MSPMAARLSVPSGFRTRSAPKWETTARKPEEPGAMASRARMSASIIGRLCRVERSLETVDLPVAMPPVRPMTGRQ